jgi:aspartate ammonia-lyase
MRVEKDFLGAIELPDDVLYGINAFRARQNFLSDGYFSIHWYKAIGLVKKAVYLTHKQLFIAVSKEKNIPKTMYLMDQKKIAALILAAEEVANGLHFQYFIIPPLQGGAGTSINLNINEIIANRALQVLGESPGDYQKVDPIEDANIYQSTNDVIPSALKLAIMQNLLLLEEKINNLRKNIEHLEQNYRNDIRIAYTQLQAAVPSSWGAFFSAFNDALSRDWWRVSKVFERIKLINLGGGAIGNGISLPRFYIMQIVPTLLELTNLPITRAENMFDATSNLDAFVEVHAILKAHAVNLEKMVADIRLFASDFGGNIISIPQKQVGSSIMPGKVNPVIAEFAISVAHQVYANDMLISGLAAMGNFELNAYLPLIGHALLQSIDLLISANETVTHNLIVGLLVDVKKSALQLFCHPTICTSLIPYIGYHKAEKLSAIMKQNGIDIFQANEKLNLIDENKLRELLEHQNLLKQGYSVKDI